MKKDDVPQDNSRTYGGERKLFYAVDDSGNYTGVESSGWEVETYATVSAVEAMDSQRDAALADVRAGKASPLAYHMYARRMDMATLSAATGYGAWRIRRHLKPNVFAGLPDRKLAPYCEALDMDAAALRSLPDTEQDRDPRA